MAFDATKDYCTNRDDVVDLAGIVPDTVIFSTSADDERIAEEDSDDEWHRDDTDDIYDRFVPRDPFADDMFSL